MNEILLNIALIALALLALGVCVSVGRSIYREMSGMEDEAEFHSHRRTEERKNERIRQEIEKWRAGK